MDKPLLAESSPVAPDVASGKLLIECGEHSLREFRSRNSPDLIDQIEAARSVATARAIDLEILIYSGVSSPLSGGRPDRVSLQQAAVLARTLNMEGIRFCLAINGGLTLRPLLGQDVLRQIDPMLDIISSSGQTHRLRNSVVITHPGLLPHIRSNYPELETIASCIQPLYPFAEHDYQRAFEDYDFVVPLNQHTTPEFLSQYRNYADRMLVFLTLGCGIPHFAKCYVHYLDIESGYPTHNEASTRVSPKSLEVIPCQLKEPHRGCDDGALITREEDLLGLLHMGIRKFKIPRNGLLRMQVLSKLLDMLEQDRQAPAQRPAHAAID